MQKRYNVKQRRAAHRLKDQLDEAISKCEEGILLRAEAEALVHHVDDTVRATLPATSRAYLFYASVMPDTMWWPEEPGQFAGQGECANLKLALSGIQKALTEMTSPSPHMEGSPKSEDVPERLLQQPEGQHLERKASFQFDHRQGRQNSDLRREVATAVCAFLNAAGGMLIIGVDNAGDVCGLGEDYHLLGRAANRDGFQRAVMDYLRDNLTDLYPQDVSVRIEPLNGKDVCLVTVRASSRPVYLKKGCLLVAREGSQSMTKNSKQAAEYIMRRWQCR